VTFAAEELPMTRLLILLTAPIFNCEHVHVHDFCEDQGTLQGTWRVRSALICGTPFEGGYRNNKVLLVFSGRMHRFGNETRDDWFEPAKYSLAWEEGRKTVRFYDAATGDVRWKAIYAFEGNALLLKMPPEDTPARRESIARGSMKWEDSGVTLVLTRGEEDLPRPGAEKANQKEAEVQKERTEKRSPAQDSDDPFRIIETPVRSEGEGTEPASPSAHRQPASRYRGRDQGRTRRSATLLWRCRRLGKIRRPGANAGHP
jgi:hypothetical protein